jgi:hypothetical protein
MGKIYHINHYNTNSFSTIESIVSTRLKATFVKDISIMNHNLSSSGPNLFHLLLKASIWSKQNFGPGDHNRYLEMLFKFYQNAIQNVLQQGPAYRWNFFAENLHLYRIGYTPDFTYTPDVGEDTLWLVN